MYCVNIKLDENIKTKKKKNIITVKNRLFYHWKSKCILLYTLLNLTDKYEASKMNKNSIFIINKCLNLKYIKFVTMKINFRYFKKYT